ncbi:MAG: hypothetical protein J6Y20_11390 [Lachnospiraceae bacterium]|nr:hypothetical protein [Lachnospiraceae bacterium]
MSKADFDKDFITDEEVEQEIDSVIAAIGAKVEADENRTSIINPRKIQQGAFCYKTLRYMLKGTGATVAYHLHEPYTSMGCVSVVGKDISFRNPRWLIKMTEYASNVEVYPKTDGTVQMNFTFHGLTVPIE